MSESTTRKRRRKGGRKTAPDASASVIAPPTRQTRSPFAPLKAVSDDELEAIHQASLEVLQEIGMDFLHEGARKTLKDAGADVAPDGERVRFDKELVESCIGLAPEQFTMYGRNAERNLNIGGDWITYCSVGSAPNCADKIGGRRPGNREDFIKFIKLGHMLSAVNMWGGYPVEPADIHPSVRHLEALPLIFELSDKPVHAYSLGYERITDAIEMVRIVRGVDDETLESEPSVISVINSSSPLRLDTPMLEGVIQLAKRNQPIIMTPFTLAGAMAPVTVAGALVQQNAEALAGLVISQLTRKGAPFVYGGFTSNVDMKSGAPAFGTPEFMKSTLVGGQLARRYKVPYRASNVNAANMVDAQAAYESVFSLWGSVMGGVNIVKHAAGWMEGGLQASFEKMVLDADLLDMVSEFLRPLTINDDTLALDAMREVGPGGHFFGCEHTQSRYKTAFFQPMISDWRNYEAWEEAGAPDALETGNKLYQEIIESHTAPPMDASIREELQAFTKMRIEAGGAPTDF